MSGTRSIAGAPMAIAGLDRSVVQALRRDAAVREIVRSHRRLTRDCTGVTVDRDRSTVVACSGGADSLALLIALGTTSIPLACVHVVHDIRPERETALDRDHAQDIAARLGVPFAQAAVSARSPGNIESNARRARYAALARIARSQAAAFVATGHHADDVLETMLMRLSRGAGPRGLAGPRATRRIDRAASAVWIVRPMLSVSRADAERICTLAGVGWRHDSTNDDTALLRNAIRAKVVPVLKELAPGIERRAARSARLLDGAAQVVAARARSILETAASSTDRHIEVDRAMLKQEPPIIVGEVIRLAALRSAAGKGMDKLASGSIDRVVRAVRDDIGGLRTFRVGGVAVRVTRDALSMEPVR